MKISKHYFTLMCFLVLSFSVFGETYYFDPVEGDDQNSGISIEFPFKSLQKVKDLQLMPGDQLLLSAGKQFNETLVLLGQSGTSRKPILISSYSANNKVHQRAKINASGYLNGILIQNCSHLIVKNIDITADGTNKGETEQGNMRCGVLVTTSIGGLYENITLKNLDIQNVFYEDPGFQRGKSEVRTANGSQSYGWGMRFINRTPNALIKDVQVSHCNIQDVAHTGIKFTAFTKGIQNIKVHNCQVIRAGGPGVQLSGVHKGHIFDNIVNYSGSADDSRKWGRGSGLWTWGSSDILIEKNEFRNANGPGDSAGCHIDFNCRNVIVQYNFSYNNAGGFIEILGNNYNCAYRYNISVNDGYRVKGKKGAFQEGKTFWLSGYQGNKKQNGPFNSYIYNNTIYVDSDIVAKIAVTKAAKGVLVANNIFCIKGESEVVLGDQYKPEKEGEGYIPDVIFKNNLFPNRNIWPQSVLIQDEVPAYGDPEYSNPGGFEISDYLPTNSTLIKNAGITIPMLPGDSIGLFIGLKVKKDILGNRIKGKPDMGAIELPNK